MSFTLYLNQTSTLSSLSAPCPFYLPPYPHLHSRSHLPADKLTCTLYQVIGPEYLGTLPTGWFMWVSLYIYFLHFVSAGEHTLESFSIKFGTSSVYVQPLELQLDYWFQLHHRQRNIYTHGCSTQPGSSELFGTCFFLSWKGDTFLSKSVVFKQSMRTPTSYWCFEFI